MINSEIINNRQNEEQYLKIQYAARRLFNEAEKINYLSWIFCLLSALMIFVPDNTIKIISIGIPILLDIFALISNFIFTNKLQSAANLRNYFDAEVLVINEDEYTQLEKQKIRELYSQLKTFSKKLISYFHIEND